MSDRVLETPRLSLPPMTVGDLEALIAGKRERVTSGLVFPDPFRAPPENHDVLELFRADVVRRTAWPPRFVVRREDRMVLGSAGLVTPDAEGTVLVGYAVYPEFEKRGYAKEAVAALVAHALAQPGIRRVRATIHAQNIGSRKVAAHAGLVHTGETLDPKEGMLETWDSR